jgi:hypothetical protein
MVDRSLAMTNHDPRMMRQELEQIREWAIEMLAAGTEPPWSWYQYMKLREASESILAGMDMAQPAEDSQESALHLRLVGTVVCNPINRLMSVFQAIASHALLVVMIRRSTIRK